MALLYLISHLAGLQQIYPITKQKVLIPILTITLHTGIFLAQTCAETSTVTSCCRLPLLKKKNDQTFSSCNDLQTPKAAYFQPLLSCMLQQNSQHLSIDIAAEKDFNSAETLSIYQKECHFPLRTRQLNIASHIINIYLSGGHPLGDRALLLWGRNYTDYLDANHLKNFFYPQMIWLQKDRKSPILCIPLLTQYRRST